MAIGEHKMSEFELLELYNDIKERDDAEEKEAERISNEEDFGE